MVKKLRIAIILDAIDDDSLGGSYISGKRFAEGLAKAGHDIILITSKFSHPEKRKHFAYAKLYEFPTLPPLGAYKIRFSYTSAKRLRAIFQQEKIDIIYSIQPTILARQAVRAANKLHIPIISHSHTLPDLFLPKAPHFLQKLVKKFVASMYRKYDGLIYPTQFLKKRWADSHFQVPEIVIGNGVDTNIFYPNQEEKSEICSLLYVGRLDPGKNVSVFLDAIHLLHNQKKLDENFHCTIVGGGSEEKRLKQRVTDYKLGNRVTFTGMLPMASSMLIKKFQAASVFILPSLYETEGMVVLEAMACGCPIVVADSPSSASSMFVHNNGYTFDPHDPQDLADKIFHLISDHELLARMGKASLDNVKDFSFTTSVKKLELFLSSFVKHI